MPSATLSQRIVVTDWPADRLAGCASGTSRSLRKPRRLTRILLNEAGLS